MSELPGINFLVPINVAKQFVQEINVENTQGKIDEYWKQGLEYYWGNHFSKAIEQFNKVLDLYPGHPYAERYSRQAKAAIAEGKDVPLSPLSSLGFLPMQDMTWIFIVIIVVIVLAFGLIIIRRRSH